MAQQRPRGSTPQPRSPSRSRRRFLGEAGAVGLGAFALPPMAGLLSACGTEDPVAPTVVPLFSPDRVLVAGRPQRIPLAVVSPDPAAADRVVLPDDDEEILVAVAYAGEIIERIPVAGRVVDHDHVGEPDPDHQHADLFRYYPLRATLPEPGIYDLTIEIGAVATELPIQAFAPDQASVVLPGDHFPPVTTPTVEDPTGVDRLCTRFEPCPFHALDAARVVGDGQPLVVLVATPAFCSTAYCGPVVDTLVEAIADRPGAERSLHVIHVEVYANPDEVGGNYLDPAIRLIPAVQGLGLTFEPSLFLVGGNGVVVDRIDNVFDRTELDQAIDLLLA